MKKMVAVLLTLVLFAELCSAFAIPAHAATALSISQPDNWEYISKSDPPTLKWNKISGAAGYTVTVKNDATGTYYTQNEWTTKNSYSLSNLFDDALSSSEYPRLKIWVGAMQSTDISLGLISLDAQDSIIAVVSEVPDVSISSPSSITANGATLKMSIDKDYGSDIEDSGFYVGTSSTKSRMTKYSFEDYGSYSATAKGTKTMTLTNLDPSTKYYVRAYAVNGVGEEYTSAQNFTTKAGAASVSLSNTSVSLNWGGGNEASVTVTATGTYSCEVEYNVGSDATDYNYEWLNYSVSGNTLTVMPKRANYSASARVAYVTVTCGSASKTLMVTQKACGEAAPSIVIKKGTSLSSLTTVPAGTNWGNYSAKGTDTLYLYAGITNVRKITVNVRKVGDTYAVRSDTFTPSTTTGDTACFVPVCDEDGNGLSAGEYQVDIWSSNSVTDNDYWAQKPDKITMYFGIQSGASSGTPSTPAGVSERRCAAIDRAYEWYNTTWKLVQSRTAWDGTVISAETVVRGIPYSCASGYVGYGVDNEFASKDFFALENEKKYNKNYGADCVQFVWDCIYAGNASVGSRGSFSTIGTYIDWEDILPGDIFLRDDYPGRGDHVMLIVDVDDNNTTACSDDKYTIIDCTSDAIGNTYDGILSMGIRKNTYPYSSVKNGGGCVGTGGDGLGPGYKPFRISALDAESEQCNHSWSVVGTNEDGNTIKRCTKCGEEVIAINTKPGAGQYVASIEFDAGNGSGAPDTITTATGNVLTIPDTEPTRSGYTFLGWSTNASATSAQYEPGDSMTVTESITLYAVWKKNSSSGGGSSGGGTTPEPEEDYVFTLISSSTSSATISVKNDTGWDVSARLIIAAYTSNHKMLGCEVIEKDWANGTNAELTISYGSDASYVKVFILNNVSNVPIFEVWKKSI